MEKQNMNYVAEEMDDYEVLPDYFVLENERENSGYSKDGVYFLRFLRAKQLFEKGLPVFLLNSDNTEKTVAALG